MGLSNGERLSDRKYQRTSPLAFAVDEGRRVATEPLIILLEPGTGEAPEIPANLIAFHEKTLVDCTEADLDVYWVLTTS
jgi:hypothetical protein